MSDPIPLAIAAGQNLAVSIHFHEEPPIESFHWDGKRAG